jgi:hypothetical protein
MIRELIGGAWRLDQWLKDKVGRPYTILLTAALIAGISANVRAVEGQIGHAGNLTIIVLTVVFDAILLINQLAQLHEYREVRRQKRAEKRAEKRPENRREKRPGDQP